MSLKKSDEFDDLIQRAEALDDPAKVRELLKLYCEKFKGLVTDCQREPEKSEPD